MTTHVKRYTATIEDASLGYMDLRPEPLKTLALLALRLSGGSNGGTVSMRGWKLAAGVWTQTGVLAVWTISANDTLFIDMHEFLEYGQGLDFSGSVGITVEASCAVDDIEGYRRVGYLESDNGRSYIDTGVPWGGYDWEVEFTCCGTFYFGLMHQNVATGTWNHLRSTKDSSSYFWKNYTDRYNFAIVEDGSKVRLSCADGLYINDVRVNANKFTKGSDNPTNINIILFTTYDFYATDVMALNVHTFHSDFVIKTTQHVPLRHFISAVRTSDNKPGMYDACGSICPLTNTPFYINSGTGNDFVVPSA